MARRARVTTWYARQFARVLSAATDQTRAVARTVRNLTDAEDLPGASDFEASAKPVGRAWVRRARGSNVWVWYRYNPLEVLLLTVTTEPPVPVDDAG